MRGQDKQLQRDLRALVRLFALSISRGGYSGAEDLIHWAYENKDNETSPSDFVEKYLSIDGPVSASLKNEFITRFIENNEQFPVQAVKSVILHMPYEDFLKTPYWKSISKFIKNRDFNRCEICGSQKRLHVHHKTYNHHGDELHHLDDLITLCRTCHSSIHEKRIYKTIPGD